MNWILLALLGLFTLWMLRQGVARFTNVRWQLLWGVMMLPPSVWVVSREVLQLEPPPLAILLLFFASYITSVILLRRGRLKPPQQNPLSPELPDSKRDSTGDDGSTASQSDASPTPATVLPQLSGWQPTPDRSLAEVPQDKLRGCFPWTVYYLKDLEYRPQAIICRGNLRSDPDEAYDCIKDNIENRFGERFLLVLQEGFAGKPFFALVPNPAARKTKEEIADQGERPGLALALLVATLISTTIVGAIASGLAPETLFSPPWNFLRGLPYALGLSAILAAHELGRYVAARRHQLKTTLPYFIPVPFVLGTFGAFVQLKGPVPNRKSLFDVAISGPLAGLAIALPLLIWGLTHSEIVPFPLPVEGETVARLNLDLFDPSLSILLAIVAKMALGSALEPGTVIHFSPIGYAGWLGLLVIALNLMPIGQLGGGHIVHAVYGHQMGANIGKVARILVLLLAFSMQEWLKVWALLMILLSSIDEPALNDVTDLDERRDLLGLGILTLLVLVVLPVPPILQSLLGLA